MADLLDRPAVRVGGTEIPAAAIAAEMQNHPSADAEDAWQKAARALVVRDLLLGEAMRLGVEPRACHDEDGRALTSDDGLIQQLIEQEVTIPSANEQEARRFYDLHRDRFVSEVLVEAEHILFSAAPGDTIAYNMALSDARSVIRQLQDNPDQFATLAQTHSDCPSREQGGNLGQISPGQTVAEFEDVLFALNAGEMAGEPVRTRYGVHVVRAGRKVEAKRLPFYIVDSSIRAYLEETAMRRAMAQYLAILAAQIGVEGVNLPPSDGPLVQ